MAKTGVENAVWALTSLRQGVSIARLLGGQKRRDPVGHGVGIQNSVERLLDIIASYLEYMFSRIKLKIGRGWDLTVLEKVRSRYPELPLMVDANTDYRWPRDRETLEDIHDSAHPNGVGCWVGQVIETGLALTYGLALASLDNCIYHNDLIPTQYYLADDIIIPAMTLNSDSTVDVPDTPGMGGFH